MTSRGCRGTRCRRFCRKPRASDVPFRGAREQTDPAISRKKLQIPGSRCTRPGMTRVIMTTSTAVPTSGLITDNVVGFARALRAAGIPVGPGAVIDALNALQVIEIGIRADVFTTLEAIFFKRHEHALVFAQ